MSRVFTPLPAIPDNNALELEILDWWERERIFDRVREANRDGPRWSFIDGPVTANKTLGVHTAWGRTLKDVFHRYKALRGFDMRWQNGWDCQGLWIEVGVERDLGLNSKRDIEEYGLDRFARKCRDVVVWSSNALTEGSKRLGQWMDWGNDYFTFSDTNIEYIWRFLKIVHERGWLYLGHRSTEWCPRCGTSISQHELSQSEVYREREDPSLYVRFPLRDRDGEALVVWTTTPWTLPANVAAAVKPDAEYGLRDNGDWVALARYPGERFVHTVRGQELVGLQYSSPFDQLPVASAIEHPVIPWDGVTLDEGTGIVHIAPGCGAEDFELGRAHDLPVLTPVDEAGRFYDGYGWLHGLTTVESADQIVGYLRERNALVDAGLYKHRYPHCWRCDTALIFRIADDWFIRVDEVRQPLIEASATVKWTPDYSGKRMEDWLRNMGDWNISRRRFFGLPLPFYPCSCGHLNVIGSKSELEERAVSGLEQLEELHRPWIDAVPIRCESCGGEVERIKEVGDVWLDAGIVPFSTLGWQNDGWIPGGYATGASRGLSGADLPDHAYWEAWFPADWVSEMREQIRLWFYSLLFMSVTLTGRAPYREVLTYEKLLDAEGREMHGSWGNMIEAPDAFEQMGADVMRWLYCQQPPTQNIRFGYALAEEAKRKLLTLWNSIKFLVDYANLEAFRPDYADLATGPRGELRPLDRWLLARTQRLVADATDALEAQLTYRLIDAFDSFVDDLSNWYIRRSRRRFWSGDETALRTLWYAVVQAMRVVSPVMPFLSEHVWQNVVAGATDDAPDSIFLAGWPEPVEALVDDELVAEIQDVIAVVRLGRKARDVAGIKHRQPLRRIAVEGPEKAKAHKDEIADELSVKEVVFQLPANKVRLKPNLRVLGPRLGARLPAIRSALEAGEFELASGGDVIVDGERLGRDEVLGRERVAVDPAWVFAEDDDVVVALDTSLTPELELEGRARDLIHQLNTMRKEAGLELSDRIRVTLPREQSDLLTHYRERIASEVLAVAIETDGEAGAPEIAKA